MIVEGDDRFGDGVNIASRLEQLAEPGGILVSGKVSKEVEKKLAFAFEPLGEQKIKNIAEPVSIYRVKVDGKSIRSPPKYKQFRMRAWTIPAAIASLFLTVAVSWFFWDRYRPNLTALPTVAVLPLDNMGDPSLQYFADGMTENLITSLARSPQIRVTARSSTNVYKGKSVDARQIGKELNSQYLLEGSVQKNAETVRLVAQLIDTRSGNHVWAERFDRTGSDPFALQDEVAEKIVEALAGLEGKIKRREFAEAWGKNTADLTEYDYYLRGHDLILRLNRRLSRSSHSSVAKKTLAHGIVVGVSD